MRRVLQGIAGFTLLALMVGGLGQRASAADKIYFSMGSKIQRANLDGTGVEDVVTGVSAEGIALDVAGGTIYWSGFFKIQRANIDGTGVEDLIIGIEASRIALDLTGGKIYWTDPNTPKVQRANLDGTNVEDLITTGVTQPVGIALDVNGGKIYFTDEGGLKIQRANLDGSGLEDLVTTGFISGTGIRLDLAGRKMYWSDAGGKVSRANLDGSSVEEIVTFPVSMNARDVGLDVARGKLYWTEFSGELLRADLDGRTVEPLLTGVGEGIALDVPAVPSSALTVFPPSGTLTTTLTFDVGLIVIIPSVPEGLSIVGGSASFDGIDVTANLVACIIPGTVLSGGNTFRCPSLSGAVLGSGVHTFSVILNLSNGASLSDAVTWEVLANSEP